MPENFLRPIRLGGPSMPHNVWLAPMAGYTDRTFRALCRGMGAGLVFSEMVSAASIVHGNAKAFALAEPGADANFAAPFALQIFGHDPHILSECVKRLESVPFQVIDFNMGCPVPKVTRNGDGSALMRDPALAARCVSALVSATEKPVTVKMRKGFTEAGANAPEVARAAEGAGAAAVTVHGRTRPQLYAGKADWDIIAAVKEAVRIPVIGNGDVTDGASAARMLKHTGCDGVMVGRAALGDPWVFARITRFLSTGETPAPPEWTERIQTAVAHLRAAVAEKGERAGLPEMRKHLAFYLRGHPGASALRRRVNEAATAAEAEAALILASEKVYRNCSADAAFV